MRLRLFDLVGIVAVLCWLGWVVVTAMAEGDGFGEVERIELTDAEREAGWRDGVEWQGIYLKDKKVGYIKLEKRREGERFRLESTMLLHLTAMKTRQKITTETKAWMSSDMTLESFEVDIRSGPADMHMEGEVSGLEVSLSIESGGSVQRQTITLKQPPKLNQSLGPILASGDLKVGDKRAISFFDPGAMTERELVFEYKGTETMVIMEKKIEAHHFIQKMGGLELDMWTNDIGEVLRETLPMGLVGQRESGVEARYGVTTGTIDSSEDIIDAVSVRPTGRPLTVSLSKMIVDLSGLSFEGLAMDGGGQRWHPSEDGMSGRLEIALEALAGREVTIGEVQEIIAKGGPLAEELSAALAEEPMIQVTNSRIKHRALQEANSLASNIGDKGVLATSRSIGAWAYGAIKKESVVGVPSAIETLSTLRGDCNEHTTLTVALLRSIGVPARPAVGIAYIPEQGRFFYHAWVEVWAGGWVAGDPTFGQFPADVGHIRFVTGGLSEQVEMFRVIGQLKIHHP